MTECSVLIVEDSFYSADLNIREIKKAGVSICRHQVVASGPLMQKALRDGKWDLIISDNSMPDFSALEALEIRNRECSEIPFIIVSEDILQKDIEKAYAGGCAAFVMKEELHLLRRIVREVLGLKDLKLSSNNN